MQKFCIKPDFLMVAQLKSSHDKNEISKATNRKSATLEKLSIFFFQQPKNVVWDTTETKIP